MAHKIKSKRSSEASTIPTISNLELDKIIINLARCS